MIKKHFSRKNKSNKKNTLKHKKTSYKKSHAKKQNKKSRKLNSKNSRKSRKSRRSIKKGGEGDKQTVCVEIEKDGDNKFTVTKKPANGNKPAEEVTANGNKPANGNNTVSPPANINNNGKEAEAKKAEAKETEAKETEAKEAAEKAAEVEPRNTGQGSKQVNSLAKSKNPPREGFMGEKIEYKPGNIFKGDPFLES